MSNNYLGNINTKPTPIVSDFDIVYGKIDETKVDISKLTSDLGDLKNSTETFHYVNENEHDELFLQIEHLNSTLSSLSKEVDESDNEIKELKHDNKYLLLAVVVLAICNFFNMVM